jgi:hypothetical protein
MARSGGIVGQLCDRHFIEIGIAEILRAIGEEGGLRCEVTAGFFGSNFGEHDLIYLTIVWKTFRAKIFLF